jgi:hypothetical protein
MRKRTRYTLFAVFILLAALATVVFLRQKAPPEAARLLPESDAIVYLDLRPLRVATHFDRKPVDRSPSYQHFIEATGIIAERDLDRVALALHRMENPQGPNGPVAFSEVLEGRFDAGKLAAYLATLASRQEIYAGRTIYDIPSEGRTLRVAILGYDMVAASNMPTTEQIHSMLDRQRAAASPFAGSSLLAARYGDVPAFSSAWAIGHIGFPFAAPASRSIRVLGLQLPVAPDATLVASLQYTAALRLRIDEIASSPDEAAQDAKSLNALLNLVRTIQSTQQPAPRTPDELALRSFMDSIAIEPRKDRATLTATLPAAALQHLALPQ